MARNYTVSTKIMRPVAEVFAAVVSRDQMKNYFVDDANEDLRAGKTIRWRWDHYGESLVVVKSVELNKRIELTIDSNEWDKTANDSYDVAVIFEFEALDDASTRVSISEDGWKTDAEGLKASHENCGGWMHMATCLKAWMEHDIDLR